MADKWILVSDGTPQCLYVGKVDLNEDGKPFISKDGFLTLSECRYLRTMMIPTPQGIEINNSVQTIGVTNGPIALAIKPAMYYWPDQDQASMSQLERMIAGCERQEAAHRAQAAGLSLVSSMPKLGKLIE